jgi:CheY-like chemotaxis protein
MMAGKHILVVDDDADVREALRLILEPKGYRLTFCATGPLAQEAIKKEPPDLILLDIMLATVSEGLHIAYSLKKDEALSRIPIIMISSIGQAVGLDYAKEVGTDYVPAECFLNKPLEANSVIRAVEQALVNARKLGDRDTAGSAEGS